MGNHESGSIANDKAIVKPFVTGNVLIGISALIIAIGLPITLLANKYYLKTYAT